MEPDCVAFDEASSMLDPPSRAELLALIDRLVEGGMTVVHVTHDMAEAARADRLVALEKGRLAFDGPAEAFFSPGPDGSAPPASELGLPLPGVGRVALALGLEPRLRESAAELAGRVAALLGRAAAGPMSVDAASTDAASTDAASTDARAETGEEAGAAFELEGVSYSYLKGTSGEHAALRDVSLSLPAGAVVALVGRTGSGKSTLLPLLDGLSFPGAGRVRAFGEDTRAQGTDLRGLRLGAPLSIQRPESALFETYAGDDVAYGPRNLGLKGPALVERVRESMESVGLPFEAYRDRLCRGLSGGEKRKLALAGVLALEPRALLLDEPTSALDPETKGAVDDLLFRKRRGGRTIVFASHSMEEAALADLVVVISGGEVLASGPPRRIFYEDFEPLWGIGRPFACELALELERLGLPVGRPLDLTSLIASLQPLQPEEKAGVRA
jgi:energy-coupling factor transport system ATP-binding protein